MLINSLIIQYQQSIKVVLMIDSSLFPQFNRQIIVQSDRILLNWQKCDYTLSITLQDQKINKISKISPKDAIAAKLFIAIYGIIQLQKKKYLILVTKASVVGQIMKNTILRVEKLEFICLSHTQSDIDKTYIKGLTQVLDNQSLYFSINYDLTLTFQTYAENNCRRTKPRSKYFYNEALIDELNQIEAIQWITSFISGFIAINYIELNQQNSVDLCLLTRRDRRRQGMRYLTRGLNQQGDAANACQTEVIMSVEQNQHQEYFSYLQLRGSIPLAWSQYPDMKFTPKCLINSDQEKQKELAGKHYDDIQQEYKRCSLINLIDHKRFQQRLGTQFEKIHGDVNKQGFDFIWFDFHAECKKSKHENLVKLLDQIAIKIKQFGYCRLQHQQNNELKFYQIKRQIGIIRTNCIDCLDRTNVVQSVIARNMIVKWLVKSKIIQYPKEISAFPILPGLMQQVFKEQWIQNANKLSFLYAGTDAMKISLTKYGKRTVKGVFHDAKVGAERYILGNFYDSRKQDYINLSLKKIQPYQNQSQRIRHSAFNSIYIVIGVLISIPFLVSAGVDWLSQQQTGKVSVKLGLTAAAYVIFYKTCNLLNRVLVRRPL